MASTNQSPFYQRAEEDFLEATTDEERISCLETMIRECPKHKSSENMLKNLKNRLKRLKESALRQRRSGKSSREGIRKTEMQCVLAGFPNTGKSTIFERLTGNGAKVSPHPFTTVKPQMGTLEFEDIKIQIIDIPSFPQQDKNILNNTDTILLVVDDLDQIPKLEDFIYLAKAKRILLFNKKDLLSKERKRKLEATLRSKYKGYDFIFFSNESSKEDVNALKKKIFETFPIIRVYTKEPRKEASKEPMVLKEAATFGDAVERILKGLSKRIKRARVWGPSSKFGGQVVGLNHRLKDKDIIEFQTE